MATQVSYSLDTGKQSSLQIRCHPLRVWWSRCVSIFLPKKWTIFISHAAEMFHFPQRVWLMCRISTPYARWQSEFCVCVCVYTCVFVFSVTHTQNESKDINIHSELLSISAQEMTCMTLSSFHGCRTFWWKWCVCVFALLRVLTGCHSCFLYSLWQRMFWVALLIFLA